MKYRRATNVELGGTSYKGDINITYDKLVDILGKPTKGGDKTQAEWLFKFEDGTVASVYDWKEDIPPEEVEHWYVGGNSHKSLYYMVAIIFRAYKELMKAVFEDKEQWNR